MKRPGFHTILFALTLLPMVGALPACSRKDAAPRGGNAVRSPESSAPSAPASSPTTTLATCDSIAGVFERHGFVPVTPPSGHGHDDGTCELAFTLDGTEAGVAVREELTGNGWTDVLEKSADGPDGTHFVLRRDSIEVEVIGSWQGGLDAPPPTRSDWSVVVSARASGADAP